MKAAEKIAPGQVRPAISLVGYGADVARAIEFVFGDTLICDTADVANRVTFHPSVMTKSVTVEGDVYDPSGTMTGGSAPSGNRVLLEVRELHKIEERLAEAKEVRRKLDEEEAKHGRVRNQWTELGKQLEMKEHELRLMEEQVQGSNAQNDIRRVEEAEANVEKLNAAVKNAVAKQAEAKEEIKKLEKDMAEFSTNKDGKIDELKVSISRFGPVSEGKG
mgnify:CR=1 FL=1